jgi:hypothetical protein
MKICLYWYKKYFRFLVFLVYSSDDVYQALIVIGGLSGIKGCHVQRSVLYAPPSTLNLRPYNNWVSLRCHY